LFSKRAAPILVILVAAALVALAVWLVGRVLNGDDSLLRNATVRDAVITPNADGDTDATLIHYELSRNATVSIYLENAAGERFTFRQDKPRGAGEYEVLFSGVVDGYRLPGETIAGDILARLLRDGDYTWSIVATDLDGVSETQSGTLTIAAADPELPEIRNFSLDKDTFTPNRDGIADRLLAQLYLPKEVASLRVFLQMPDGSEMPIAEQERDIPLNMPGRHYFDYEGGVDNGETPPPDGTYPLIAVAEDLEGQRVRAEVLAILTMHAQSGVAVKEDSHITGDLGIDSLGVMEVLADIEDKFHLSIPDESLRDVDTVASVIRSIEKRLSDAGRLQG